MTIKTKDGMTLELPDSSKVSVDGDKITVEPMQVYPQPSVIPVYPGGSTATPPIPEPYTITWTGPYGPTCAPPHFYTTGGFCQTI